MADISKLKLPNGNEYDLKVYTDHIAPMMTKTFTGVIGTANNFANATFYFGTILPIDSNVMWCIKYRIDAITPSTNAARGYYQVQVGGTVSDVVAYKVFNFQRNTSYRPTYNHIIYRATASGIVGGYGHLLGERLYSSWNATTAANARTFTIDILECVNCSFTFFDEPKKFAEVPGTGTVYYNTYSELNGTTQGITRTGTDANDVNYQNRVYYSASNAMLSYAAGGRYTLSFSKNDHYILPITSTDNVTNGGAHTYTTESFNPFGEIYYRNSSGAIAANATVGNATLYRQVLVDARYSFTGVLNGASSVMSAGKPVYIVCVPQLDGTAKLYTNPLGFTLPSSEDGLLYILLGYASNTYQFELLIHHPVYMYKNGGVRVLTGMSQYAIEADNAITVSGHHVAKDVPSDAVFTDTTYSLATTTTDGLMSSADKLKLSRIGGSYDSTTETITLSLDGSQIEHYVSDAYFSTALLACLRNVAWVNNQGQSYYNVMHDALYENVSYFITAVFTQPQTTVYTDDALDTLKSNLVVTYYSPSNTSGTVLADSAYTLSGTLVEGTNTVTVTYDSYTTVFTVTGVVDFYNVHVRALNLNNLLKVNGGTDSNIDASPSRVRISSLDNQNIQRRRTALVDRGKARLYRLANGSSTEYLPTDYYPIPVPLDANHVKITMEPTGQDIYAHFIPYNASTQTYGDSILDNRITWTTLQNGTVEKNLVRSDSNQLFMLLNMRYNSSASDYPVEPTAIMIEFSEV